MSPVPQLEDHRGPRAMLEEFITTFGPPNDPAFWQKLVNEEFREVTDAAQHLLKELADFAYVMQGYLNAGGDPLDLTLPEGTLNDRLFTRLLDAFGAETAREAFREVHRNNMSKVQPDGTVKRREDGKVLKPEGYVPVDLTRLVI